MSNNNKKGSKKNNGKKEDKGQKGGFGYFPREQVFKISVANWNIMDHMSTEYSRLGNVETPEEYTARYNRVIQMIQYAANKWRTDVICLEEVTEEFLALLMANPLLSSRYTLYQYRNGNFILATLVGQDSRGKPLNVVDFSGNYQQRYHDYEISNMDKPSRTQILMVNGLLVIHVHFVGVPGTFGNMLRVKNFGYIMKFLNEEPIQDANGNRLYLRSYNKIVIGDYNDSDPGRVVPAEKNKEDFQAVYKINGLELFQDSRPTSYHRYVKHNIDNSENLNRSNCGYIYEDKQVTQRIPTHEKLDHLLYDYAGGVQIEGFAILPEQGTTYLQVPYIVNYLSDNLERKNISLCSTKTSFEIEEVDIVKDPNNINIISSISEWPSDHAYVSYLIRYITGYQ